MKKRVIMLAMAGMLSVAAMAGCGAKGELVDNAEQAEAGQEHPAETGSVDPTEAGQEHPTEAGQENLAETEGVAEMKVTFNGQEVTLDAQRAAAEQNIEELDMEVDEDALWSLVEDDYGNSYEYRFDQNGCMMFRLRAGTEVSLTDYPGYKMEADGKGNIILALDRKQTEEFSRGDADEISGDSYVGRWEMIKSSCFVSGWLIVTAKGNGSFEVDMVNTFPDGGVYESKYSCLYDENENTLNADNGSVYRGSIDEDGNVVNGELVSDNMTAVFRMVPEVGLSCVEHPADQIEGWGYTFVKIKE